ncbi:uncharacterized protein [Elaeis guineensis]|uniref:Uncharacterized protein LOC105036225 n=1 Tax=Elaeis guineensis var. tenera TaxID=51953 RepID=A0A6I9QIW6_ELAGV|nr:uncharacterized protein LOC105036225 [Elaeis guineensis]
MSTAFDFVLPKATETPSPLSTQWTGLKISPFSPSSLPIALRPKRPIPIPFPIQAISHQNHYHHPFPLSLHPIQPTITTAPTTVSAGRSKKKPGGPSPGRIEGNAEVRRQAKENARRRSRRRAENRFYRRNRSNGNYADHFTEDELQMIGLGYDRSVRFLQKDDPDLRHPYDWYKYGRYGPYSWRGIVIGPPIRGRFTDDRVSIYGEVRDHEEFEEIEQFEMSSDFSKRLAALDSSIGFRYYWVFVRHPKWRPTELPWQQWTLVCEVALEAGKEERLDKWSLMARLGNKTRAMITQCAAWMRPDIIYVKRPVYQSRFEPQDDFFKLLGPLLDPTTENEYPCELKTEGGRVETCTYFGGLCKIVKISPKAYVDDVVKAYQKLGDKGKSRCLEFLLTNHPMELLHPYTKEWKAKLEEMELGCDAPDDSESENGDQVESQVTAWSEDDEEDEDDAVIDVGEEEDNEEVATDRKESAEYWIEQWKKAMRSSDEMENFVKKSIEISDELYERQMMEEQRMKERMKDGNLRTAVLDQEERNEEFDSEGDEDPKEGGSKSKKPSGLFLRAAVRPFTYRNLVKEIVLMRHGIIDGDIKASG